MSENRLIIAAAGSGKTTYLVNEAVARKGSILILTYTLSNEDVIKRRLIQKVGCIPHNITVQTWFSFLLQHGVKPYQGCLDESLFKKDVRGMLLVNEQSGIKYKNKKGFAVCYSEHTEVQGHYFTRDFKIYSDKISKFSVKCNNQSNGKVIERLSRMYDNIFIDEVQDLAGYDLELLKLIFSSVISVVLVGDPRQVTYLTHLERKYAKYQNGKIREFIENELGKSIIYTIDDITLGVSHRCGQLICEYASRLYPSLPATSSCSCCACRSAKHQGVFLVKPDQAKEYAHAYSVTQLRWDKKTIVLSNMSVMNFGEAKGETFDRVLIYPTKDMVKWVKDECTKLSNGTRAKFYVALTRARYSATIVMDYDDGFNSDKLIKYISGSAA